MIPSACHPDGFRRRRSGVRWLVLGLPIWLTFWLVLPAHAQSFTDNFADRQVLTATSGHLRATNSTATFEPGEPMHGGKPGGHSLWISWVAPTNGILEMETVASSLDALLSVYTLAVTNSTNFSDLVEVAAADDTEGFDLESETAFGVVAGQRYEIALDGYRGATGRIGFEWKLTPLTNPPPVIVSLSANQAARVGDTVTLTAVVTNAGQAEFQWFFNGVETEQTNTVLTIPSLQATNVGRYWLAVSVEGQKFISRSVELQVNSEGISNTLARPKILDSEDTPLIGDDGGTAAIPPPAAALGRVSAAAGPVTAAGAGVVRGYNGTQIFDNTYATTDPAEPAHCGIAGGASYWLAYTPPANGTITLDTIGSSYDTVMEVYTYNGTLTGYSDLISVACDNDSVAAQGAARVVLPVSNQRQYLVAVDGVNGARGIARFNYNLNTNQPPQPPILMSTPSAQTVAEGSTVILTAPVAGSAPMMFAWSKDQTPIPGVSAAVLVLPAVTQADSASYSFSVSNDFGGPVNGAFDITVVARPQCILTHTAQGLELSFATELGRRYTIEQATAINGPWQAWPNYYIGTGQPVSTLVLNAGTRFYRVRVE